MPVLAATQEECGCCECKWANFCNCESLSAAVHARVSAPFRHLLIFCANLVSTHFSARRSRGARTGAIGPGNSPVLLGKSPWAGPSRRAVPGLRQRKKGGNGQCPAYLGMRAASSVPANRIVGDSLPRPPVTDTTTNVWIGRLLLRSPLTRSRIGQPFRE